MKNVQLLTRKCRSRRELPAVMVKKAARRAENMADAIKLQDACKPAGEWGSRQCQRKIVEKSGDSAFAFAGCQVFARVAWLLVFIPRCREGSFCLHAGLQGGFCHVHLNGEEQKKFSQTVARGDGSEKNGKSGTSLSGGFSACGLPRRHCRPWRRKLGKAGRPVSVGGRWASFNWGR